MFNNRITGNNYFYKFGETSRFSPDMQTHVNSVIYTFLKIFHRSVVFGVCPDQPKKQPLLAHSVLAVTSGNCLPYIFWCR